MRSSSLLLLLAAALAAGCDGASPATPVDAGPTDGPAPDLGDLDIRAVSPRNVALRWVAGRPGEVRVERGDGDGAGLVAIARRPAAGGRFLDLALTPETRYTYRLSLCDGDACGEPALLGPVVTPASHAPPVLPSVAAPPGAADDLILFDLTPAFMKEDDDGLVLAVDRDGTIVWEQFWATRPANALTAVSGHRLALSLGGLMTLIDLDGSTLAQFADVYAHHDIKELSDGRFLAVAWDIFPDPATGVSVLGDIAAIFNPELTAIDWQWRGRDHISLAERNGYDWDQVYFGLGHDWTHFNSLTLDEANGVLYVNVRNLNRIYAVAYPGGEVLWTMGDGTDFGAGLWGHSHDTVFLPNNHVMMLDNGLFRADGEFYSRVLELAFDPAAKTVDIAWEYRETPDFFAAALGGAEPEESGAILVTDGLNARIVEVTREKQKLWEVRFGDRYWIYRARTVPRAFFTEW
ncbi:MAG TPA: aryl-sulfate sulfotransferase [Polyangia bacterium]|jgi:hypothetical protein